MVNPQSSFLFDSSKFRPDFAAWLLANVAIWNRFCIEADKVWGRGRRHYGGRTIWEFIRHDTALSEEGSEFVLNNNF